VSDLNSEAFDSFAPARVGLRLAPLCRSRPRASIETCSRPRLLAATPHGFTFDVADPVNSIREQAILHSIP